MKIELQAYEILQLVSSGCNYFSLNTRNVDKAINEIIKSGFFQSDENYTKFYQYLGDTKYFFDIRKTEDNIFYLCFDKKIELD